VYDGTNYRAYTRIQDFLNGELTPRNSGMWFFAHAGGLFDIQYVLEYLIDNPRPHIRVSCAFSGSSAIIVRISNGKYSWYLLDSFWLIRQGLRDIGKWMGQDKGGKEGSTDIFYGPLDTLRDYNKQDCVILYDAIRTVEDTVLSLGGRLEMTIASTAMGLFRRKYLKQDIHTHDKINDIASGAYIASRVEVFERECQNADYWDINSSFPFSMTFDAPGNFLGTSRRLKDDDSISMVKAAVTVRPCDIPPVPYRTDDRRIYFPTGTWSQWFSSVDIRLLESQGHTVERIEEVLYFESFHDLKDYASEIYTLRKNSTHAPEKVVLKFLLNSLYGKFAEGELKSKYLINPPPEFYDVPEIINGKIPGCRKFVTPGVYEVFEERSIPHRHVPIAMHITALSRKWLYEYMVKASKVYYCDTDGFGVPDTDKIYAESNELGGLKNEKHIFEAHFQAPKLYAYRETSDGDWTVKAKGFSRVLDDEGNTRKLTYEDYQALLNKKEIHLEQFSRVRGLLKSGNYKPRDMHNKKQLRGLTRPKRHFPDDGSRSVPWTVKQLLGD
jgi:DNA polymerase type B, organellar and viral